MTSLAHYPATRRRPSTVWAILASVLLFALSMVSFSQAHTQPALSNFPSVQAAVVAPRMDLIAVRGQGLTPGGLVQITIVGEDGSGLDRQLWTTASTADLTPSAIDPMWGITPAGTIHESISMDPAIVWGPHGSQDPARGFDDPSQGSSTRANVPLCFQEFTVQAFDLQSGAQSSLVDVHATCAVTNEPPTAQAAPEVGLAPSCEANTCESPY